MKQVCVFTGNRAEYGLLAGLMKKIQSDPDLELKLVVSGAHLSPDYGLTYQEIEKDGFAIDEKVDVVQDDDSSKGISRAIGLGIMGCFEAVKGISPDVAVVLGDRYEALAFAISASLLRVPILHVHGGEASFGSLDDSFRHCITKLSQVHCVCAEAYRLRAIQLGEKPETVHNVGALGVENIKQLSLLSQSDVYNLLGFQKGTPFFLITYHPDTVQPDQTLKQFKALLDAFLNPAFSGHKLVFTYANSDAQGRVINAQIDSFVKASPDRAVSFVSMGQIRYLSALKYADCVVGNSSSGILEAPSFKTPVVNIGNRQNGRIRSRNVIDCTWQTEDVVNALKKAGSARFKASIQSMNSPFDQPETAEQIKKLIHRLDFSESSYKEFFDLPSTLIKDSI